LLLFLLFVVTHTNLGATQFLDVLDDDLVKEGASFDIVDSVTSKEMKGFSFSELIQKSLSD